MGGKIQITLAKLGKVVYNKHVTVYSFHLSSLAPGAGFLLPASGNMPQSLREDEAVFLSDLKHLQLDTRERPAERVKIRKHAAYPGRPGIRHHRLHEGGAVPEVNKMDIVFNKCCGENPMVFHTEDGENVYAQCPVCGRKSGNIPLVRHGYLQRDAAASCAKRWNEEKVSG